MRLKQRSIERRSVILRMVVDWKWTEGVEDKMQVDPGKHRGVLARLLSRE
jgi:hypothetical protein